MERLVYGQSVPGASHLRAGTKCQDSCLILNREKLPYTIIAVADGHGSKSSPRSDKGSLFAVKSFITIMKKYIERYGLEKDEMDQLITFLNREGDMRFAQDVCEEWQGRVRKSYELIVEKPCGVITSKDLKDWKEVYKLYGSTILGILITESFVFAFQIGDGDIMMVNLDGVSPVVEAEKFLGTETHSLSKLNAWKNSASSVLRRNIKEDLPYMYMLSTDGFVNSHASDKDFYKTCADYYNVIGQQGFDVIKKNLSTWLSETSEQGCGDDVTVAIAYYGK